MIADKKQKISAIGTLSHNIVRIDDNMIEWIDAAEFSLAALAKLIGIGDNQKVKAKITLEIVQEPCEICGKITTGDKLCTNCAKLVCDECAKTDVTGRYCPICFETKSLKIEKANI
ncbi:MAG: hypothetical protein KIH09_15925 [Candidatus Freyarchaeota archaeon]|nr:hypothetical protein [Candidatus Jordarchaeia archaeon]